jgi:hypothetical protein
MSAGGSIVVVNVIVIGEYDGRNTASLKLATDVYEARLLTHSGNPTIIKCGFPRIEGGHWTGCSSLVTPRVTTMFAQRGCSTGKSADC